MSFALRKGNDKEKAHRPNNIEIEMTVVCAGKKRRMYNEDHPNSHPLATSDQLFFLNFFFVSLTLFTALAPESALLS